MTTTMAHSVELIPALLEQMYAIKDHYFPPSPTSSSKAVNKQNVLRELYNRVQEKENDAHDKVHGPEALSLVMDSMDDMERAERELSSLLLKSPMDKTRLWERLGDVYVELGMLTEAKACFEWIALQQATEEDDAQQQDESTKQLRVQSMCRLSQVLRYMAKTTELQSHKVPLSSLQLDDDTDEEHGSSPGDTKKANESSTTSPTRTKRIAATADRDIIDDSEYRSEVSSAATEAMVAPSFKVLFDALGWARKAVESNISSALGWYMLGNSYQSLYTSSIYQELSPYVKVYPGKILSKAERTYARAATLSSKAQVPSCLTECTLLNEESREYLSGRNPDLYVNYADNLLTQHKFVPAINNLRTARDIDPTFDDHVKKQITLIRAHLQAIWRCIPRKQYRKSGRKLVSKMGGREDTRVLSAIESLFHNYGSGASLRHIFCSLFGQHDADGSMESDISEKVYVPRSIVSYRDHQQADTIPCTTVCLLSATPVESPLHPPVVLIGTDPTKEEAYVGIALLHLPPSVTGSQVRKYLNSISRQSRAGGQGWLLLLRDVEVMNVPKDVGSDGDCTSTDTFPILLIRDPSQIWINGVPWPRTLPI
eukprot:gb/GECG01003557.1/.p1 GENE.gb/GECG01003557.1/~~gb/GECG01003557.1/.p1  ORF type:complete len:598 (+),score=68.83 gb/GECG01003557.1/:1-1794(+)